MPDAPPFHARLLDPMDRDAAAALAVAAGSHGVYVANHLAEIDGDGDVLALYGADEILGVCYFGRRGNLVVVERVPLSPRSVAAAIASSWYGWRIVLGPADVVATLAARESKPPIVHRTQLYYRMRPTEHTKALVRDDVRPASPRDHDALIRAALDLNEADLHIDPRRVHRTWLAETVDRRIETGSTWVLGEPGRPVAKLDLGSVGPAGLVVEGVYTRPQARGRGYAASLVATTAARHDGLVPTVCLHVAESNVPARRAYERAGMQQDGECALMLRA